MDDRTQQADVEGQTYSVGQVISSVPQGPDLGPTLSLIYINDLSTNVKSTVRLFVDDTIMYRRIHSQSDTHILQEDLRTLEQWKNDWQMSFNVNKYHALSVSKKIKADPP